MLGSTWRIRVVVVLLAFARTSVTCKQPFNEIICNLTNLVVMNNKIGGYG